MTWNLLRTSKDGGPRSTDTSVYVNVVVVGRTAQTVGPAKLASDSTAAEADALRTTRSMVLVRLNVSPLNREKSSSTDGDAGRMRAQAYCGQFLPIDLLTRLTWDSRDGF
jgi:hypothetical protein